MRKHAGTVFISGCHITGTPEEENANNSKDVKKKNTTNIYKFFLMSLFRLPVVFARERVFVNPHVPACRETTLGFN